MNKCMEIRVESGKSVGRPIKIWFENVEAVMPGFEIDREGIHCRKKWRHNVMKRKSNPIGKRIKNR